MLRRSLLVLSTSILLFTAAACGDSESGASIKEFCSANDTAPDTDNLDDITKAMNEMRAKAPDEIKDDVELMSKALAAIKDVDPQDTESMEAASKVADSEKVNEAKENIDKFVEKNCK